mgnify:CR=1 FL=1
MPRTITRAYDNYAAAQGAVSRLEAAGVASSDISLLGRDERADNDDSNAGEGAGIGAAVGGAAGLLAGLGLIAIPGVGPVVAAGWLASTLAGAAAGGATGGIIVCLQTLIFLVTFYLAPKHGLLAARRKAAQALHSETAQ